MIDDRREIFRFTRKAAFKLLHVVQYIYICRLDLREEYDTMKWPTSGIPNLTSAVTLLMSIPLIRPGVRLHAVEVQTSGG